MDSIDRALQESAALPAALGAQGAPARLAEFSSFDGQVRETAWHQRPDRYRHLEAPVPDALPRIARGAGLSYAAASFGAGVVVQEMTRFSRILEHDDDAGTVTVEAGTTIGDLLSWSLARGRYLPVVPGHPDITVGGCIAADVHGKNPGRDGTFRDSVAALTLYHPDRGFLSVSPESDPEWFDATCGGFGLTGIIVAATLNLLPLPAPSVRLTARPVRSLGQAADLISSGAAPFSYSWHGAVRASETLGRGLVFSGDWSDAPVARPEPRRRPALTAESRAALRVCLWNPFTAVAASHAFRTASTARRQPRHLSFFDCCFPFERQTLYHRFFGARGLREIQLLVPVERSELLFTRLAALVRERRPTITFLSLKSFLGRARALSLSGSGLLLALDYVRDSTSAAFESAMDRMLLDLGAQPNVSKDSRLPARIVAETLPTYPAFRQQIHRLDPRRRFQSELSRRLEL
ncbi:MAG: FAD-binding oxidoreductase [Thermoanaerobaculia bacterium]|nr:FAD-binding oxidoreductase [Thermoanaerobaculia bacterium]